MQSGFNWKIPIAQKIERVNNKQQDIKFDEWVWSETSQRTAIHYENITVTYRINNEMSAWIYANVSDYKKSLINEGIVASAIKSVSKGLQDEDATNRSIIEPLAKQYLQASLDGKYGLDVVIVTKVIIGNADFEDSYAEAIAAKQRAKLEAEQQDAENEKAIKKAEADAAVTKTLAAARAEAAMIEAEATANANKTIQESLSDEIITEMWIEKWDGRVPTYLGGANDTAMIGVGLPADSE